MRAQFENLEQHFSSANTPHGIAYTSLENQNVFEHLYPVHAVNSENFESQAHKNSHNQKEQKYEFLNQGNKLVQNLGYVHENKGHDEGYSNNRENQQFLQNGANNLYYSKKEQAKGESAENLNSEQEYAHKYEAKSDGSHQISDYDRKLSENEKASSQNTLQNIIRAENVHAQTLHATTTEPTIVQYAPLDNIYSKYIEQDSANKENEFKSQNAQNYQQLHFGNSGYDQEQNQGNIENQQSIASHENQAAINNHKNTVKNNKLISNVVNQENVRHNQGVPNNIDNQQILEYLQQSSDNQRENSETKQHNILQATNIVHAPQQPSTPSFIQYVPVDNEYQFQGQNQDANINYQQIYYDNAYDHKEDSNKQHYEHLYYGNAGYGQENVNQNNQIHNPVYEVTTEQPQHIPLKGEAQSVEYLSKPLKENSNNLLAQQQYLSQAHSESTKEEEQKNNKVKAQSVLHQNENVFDNKQTYEHLNEKEKKFESQQSDHLLHENIQSHNNNNHHLEYVPAEKQPEALEQKTEDIPQDKQIFLTDEELEQILKSADFEHNRDSYVHQGNDEIDPVVYQIQDVQPLSTPTYKTTQVISEPQMNKNIKYYAQNKVKEDYEAKEHTKNAHHLINIEKSSGYGSKVHGKPEEYPSYYLQEPSKLIDNTHNLVTGQDVLNINAIVNNGNVESSTSNSLSGDYVSAPIKSFSSSAESVYSEKAQKEKNSQVYNEQSIVSTTTVASVEFSHPVALSKEPIVVAESPENIYKLENAYSSAQSQVDKKLAEENSASQSTVIVTPRPVSTQFLAPITAGVHLQSLQEQSSNQQQHDKNNVVIDIQKSVPYYLGQFDYIHHEDGSAESLNQQNSLSKSALETILRYPHVKTVEPKNQEQASSNQHLPFVQVASKYKESKHDRHSEENQKSHLEHHVSVPVPVLQPHVKPVYETVQQPSHALPHHFPISIPLQVPQPYPTEHVNEHTVDVSKFPVNVPVSQPLPYPVKIETLPINVYHPADGNTHKLLSPSHITQTPVKYAYPTNEQRTPFLNQIRNRPTYYQSYNKIPQTNYPAQYAPNYQSSLVCADAKSQSSNKYHTINSDDYIGMKPPQAPASDLSEKRTRQYRDARQNFGNNLKLEYGFMPPLIPSMEIDEHGHPIERTI